MMSMHLDRVLADVRAAGLDALLVSAPANTYYVSGFRAITYSRPVLVVAGDSPLLLIPELEATHARATSVIPAIRTYADTGLGDCEASPRCRWPSTTVWTRCANAA